MASNGQFLYARAEKFAESLLTSLKAIWPTPLISFTGAYRRRCEIIEGIDLLIASTISPESLQQLKSIPELHLNRVSENNLELEAENGIKIFIRFCSAEDFANQLIMQTGNEDHISELKKRLNDY